MGPQALLDVQLCDQGRNVLGFGPQAHVLQRTRLLVLGSRVTQSERELVAATRWYVRLLSGFSYLRDKLRLTPN